MKLSVAQSFMVGANTASLVRGADGASHEAGKGLSIAASAGGALVGAVGSTGLIFAAKDPGVIIESNAKGGIPKLISRIGSYAAQIYNSISGIVTVVALLVVIVALIVKAVAQEPKTVQMATMALKKVVICWLIINTVGYFISTGADFSNNGGVDLSNWTKDAGTNATV